MTKNSYISTLLEQSKVHPEWIDILTLALLKMDSKYLESLISDPNWLPGPDKMLRAFQRDLSHCKMIIWGESPYPRQQSANGIAFYDAAVTSLWSETGLSKPVNRATSLRNIIKTALISEGIVSLDENNKLEQTTIANLDKSYLINQLSEFFQALHSRGALLMNATPVLHPDRKPAVEARHWNAFNHELLKQIPLYLKTPPTLVLWGKIAQVIEQLQSAKNYQKLVCEHPYNISFISNPLMQNFFAELNLLRI